MTPYEWKPSLDSNRTIIGLYRDDLLVCSIVLDAGTWRPAARADAEMPGDLHKWWEKMRPDDKTEVLRKLAELNEEKL
jgi:hypothetical protein